MERFMKELSKGELKVYLIANEKSETLNVYATVGMAIDAISYNARRIANDSILELSRTKLKWRGRNGDKHFLEIRECPICKDVTLDYMNMPRTFVL